MNEVDKAFRDGLRYAVAHKPALGQVDLKQVIARGEAQKSAPVSRGWQSGRVLAVAALLVIVVSIGFGAWNMIGRFGPVSGVPIGAPSPFTEPSSPPPPSASPAAETVHVRLRNDSTAAFDKVVVIFYDRPARDYGALAPGASSGYQQPPGRAYQYAMVVVTIGDQTFRLQPTDFVGESELVPGRYTYALNISGGQLDLAFEIDD